jgi:anti-sigma factor RsiW
METKNTSSLGETLRSGVLYENAPSHLRARVLESVKPARPVRSSGASGWLGVLQGARWPFMGGGVAGIALGALGAFFAMLLFSAQPSRHGSDVAQEVVASHVRALLSTRAIDVISTDQHTVKPWFNGRIDYAPPVVDPQAQGFPLVGGRLDYVDHRAVAVLVYRYLKHPIDLYVFPSHAAGVSAASAPVVTRSPEGYSLAVWQRDGMTYWAVSDASPAYVEQFAGAIIHATGR